MIRRHWWFWKDFILLKTYNIRKTCQIILFWLLRLKFPFLWVPICRSEFRNVFCVLKFVLKYVGQPLRFPQTCGTLVTTNLDLRTPHRSCRTSLTTVSFLWNTSHDHSRLGKTSYKYLKFVEYPLRPPRICGVTLVIYHIFETHLTKPHNCGMFNKVTSHLW